MASRQSEEGFSEEVALECSRCVSWWHLLPAPRFPDAEGREDLGHGAAVLGVERTESGSARRGRLAGTDREGPVPAQGI